jgi:hypothetical protein
MLRRSKGGFTWNRNAKYAIIFGHISLAKYQCN